MKFTIKIGPDDERRGVVEAKSRIRESDNWYDIPLAAVPVVEDGWPQVLGWMDGRQYFLWMKNNFELGKGKSPFDGPILLNPFPERTNVHYEMGGEGSRRWGA